MNTIFNAITIGNSACCCIGIMRLKSTEQVSHTWYAGFVKELKYRCK